jgi:MFS family permease
MTTTPKKDGIRAHLTAVSIALCQLVIMGLYASFPVFLKAMSSDETLGRPSQTTLSLAQSIVMLTIPVVGLFAGFVCDKYGSRITLFIAGLGAVLAPLSFAFVSEIDFSTTDSENHKLRVSFAIAVYAVTMGAMAASFMSAPGPAVIGTWFSDERVSFGVGIGEAGVAAGSALMPLAAGLLLNHFDADDGAYGDWRSAMKWMSIFGAIPCLLSFVTVQRPHQEDEEEEEENEEKVDQESTTTKQQQTNNDDDIKTYGSTSTRNTQDVLNRDSSQNQQQRQDNEEDDEDKNELASVLKSKPFLVLFASQFLFGFGYFLFLFCSVPYARIMGTNSTMYESDEKISVTDASSLMTWFGVTSAIGALLLGALASKLNNRVVLGFSCVFAGILISAVLIFARVYWRLGVVYAVLGILFAGGLLCLPSMIVESFVEKYPHLLNSLMSASFAGFGLAGACAPPIATAIQENNDSKSYAGSFLCGGISLFVLGSYHLIVELKSKRENAADEDERKEKQHAETKKLIDDSYRPPRTDPLFNSKNTSAIEFT